MRASSSATGLSPPSENGKVGPLRMVRRSRRGPRSRAFLKRRCRRSEIVEAASRLRSTKRLPQSRLAMVQHPLSRLRWMQTRLGQGAWTRPRGPRNDCFRNCIGGGWRVASGAWRTRKCRLWTTRGLGRSWSVAWAGERASLSGIGGLQAPDGKMVEVQHYIDPTGPRSRGAVGTGDVAGERGDRAARATRLCERAR